MWKGVLYKIHVGRTLLAAWEWYHFVASLDDLELGVSVWAGSGVLMVGPPLRLVLSVLGPAGEAEAT